jgi:hypothetical protein
LKQAIRLMEHYGAAVRIVRRPPVYARLEKRQSASEIRQAITRPLRRTP